MTLITKHSLLTRTGWTVLAVAAALAGCSKKDEAPAAAPASAPVAAAAASAAPLKVAFAYLGPRPRLDLRPRPGPQGGRKRIRRQDRHLLRRERARVRRCGTCLPRHGHA